MDHATLPWIFLIPVVAIVGGLIVGAIAIVTEHRRKLALLEERRLMIEKGLMPPALDGSALEHGPAGSRAAIEDSLHTGVITLFVGLGLIGAFLVMRYLVFADSVFPRPVITLLGPAGVLVSLIGIGNLVYFWIARDRLRSERA